MFNGKIIAKRTYCVYVMGFECISFSLYTFQTLKNFNNNECIVYLIKSNLKKKKEPREWVEEWRRDDDWKGSKV